MPNIPQYFSQVNLEAPPVTPTQSVESAVGEAMAPTKALSDVFGTLSKASSHYADLLSGIEGKEKEVEGHALANQASKRIMEYRAKKSQDFIGNPEEQYEDFAKQAESEYKNSLTGVTDRRTKTAFESAFVPHDFQLSKHNNDLMIAGKQSRTDRQTADLWMTHRDAITNAPDLAGINAAAMNLQNDTVKFSALTKSGSKAQFDAVLTEGLKARMSKAKALGNEEYFLNAMGEGGEIRQLIEQGANINVEGLLEHQQKIINMSNAHADRERQDEDRLQKSAAAEITTLIRTGDWSKQDAIDWVTGDLGPQVFGDYSDHIIGVANAVEDSNRGTLGHNVRYRELSVNFWKSKGRIGNWDQTITAEYSAGRINAAEWEALTKMGAMDGQFKNDPAWEMAKSGVLKTLDPSSGPFGSMLSDANDQLVINNAVTELYQYWVGGKLDATGARDAVIKKYKAQMKSSNFVAPPATATHEGKQYNMSNLKEALALRASNPGAFSTDQWKAVWKQLQVQTDNTGTPTEKK